MNLCLVFISYSLEVSQHPKNYPHVAYQSQIKFMSEDYNGILSLFIYLLYINLTVVTNRPTYLDH